MYILSDKSIKNKSKTRIRIYPDLMLAAARGKNDGAVRLWFLAKHYDQPKGYGLISSIGFRDWVVNKLKWNSGTFYRYLSEAEQLGIIERKGKKLRLAAAEYAAIAAGCKHLGPDSLQTIKLKDLAGKDWKLYIFAAYYRRFNRKNIATETLEKLTGIPARTIYKYKKQLKDMGVIKTSRCYQYWHEDPRPWKICKLALHEGKHLFEHGGRILRSLPGVAFIYAKIARPPKHIREINGELKKVSTKNGQRKRINQAINAMVSNSSLSEGNTSERVKRFINDPKAKDRKKEAHKLRKVLIEKQLRGINTVDDVSIFTHEQYGARFYAAL